MNRRARVLLEAGRVGLLTHRRYSFRWARRHLTMRVTPAERVGTVLLAADPAPDVRLQLSFQRGVLRGSPLELR